MELFLGKWKIKKEVNFGEFLKFSGVPWVQRQVAQHNKINLFIETWRGVYIKTVSTTLYNTEEVIKLDDQYREYEKSSKKFYINDNVIFVDIKYKKGIFWKEEIFIKDDFLITKYIWNNDNTRQVAIQFFKRY